MSNHERKAQIFKALSDPRRIAIIELLQEGSLCACKITEQLGIVQSSLSYHMKILCDASIVECWNVGKWTHYEISKDGGENIVKIIKELMVLEG